jgi:beta-galactosidase
MKIGPRSLGVCYYPEHWDESLWAEDARRMAEAGLTWVRIGEFAWSRLEPDPERFEWDWLDRAIDTLGAAGLKVVLCTPTATPPRWMLTRHPDMLAHDAAGRPRGFGSRRHYCFSHDGYFEESRRIVTLMAARYGRNPHIRAWQTDNEYGCHDTILSWSPAALAAFCRWLRERYGTIDNLNAAWGNVFWSMEYRSFDEIGLPHLTVTEPNPAHALAFRRFSSDQVVRYNKMQCAAIRAHSDLPVAHNYMGGVTEFDHYKVGADLDIATWDSYPLGFLEDRVTASAEHKQRFAQQGDPDYQAFHHDLYRAVGKGRWWVMEQQPGPVNWAPYNPAPLPGMVRLWTWEAFAHGAEAVCYFRWRQVPFAQEQLHAGLLQPDGVDAPGLAEARRVAIELRDAPEIAPMQASVALIFDYEAEWAWNVQPHGHGLSYFELVFAHYQALRRAGLSVDIVPPRAKALSGYRMILAPGLMILPADLSRHLCNGSAEVLIGPRTGARTEDFAIPLPLPPALPDWSLTVRRLETLRPDMPRALAGGGAVTRYSETLESDGDVVLQSADGQPVALRKGRVTYMGSWADDVALDRLVGDLAARAGLETLSLPEGVRIRETGTERFWFNHNAHSVITEIGEIPGTDLRRVTLC